MIICLNSIKWLVFLMKVQCVYHEVGLEFLNINYSWFILWFQRNDP